MLQILWNDWLWVSDLKYVLAQRLILAFKGIAWKLYDSVQLFAQPQFHPQIFYKVSK